MTIELHELRACSCDWLSGLSHSGRRRSAPLRSGCSRCACPRSAARKRRLGLSYFSNRTLRLDGLADLRQENLWHRRLALRERVLDEAFEPHTVDRIGK